MSTHLCTADRAQRCVVGVREGSRGSRSEDGLKNGKGGLTVAERLWRESLEIPMATDQEGGASLEPETRRRKERREKGEGGRLRFFECVKNSPRRPPSATLLSFYPSPSPRSPTHQRADSSTVPGAGFSSAVM